MVVEPIQSVHYPLLSGDEGRKQLYWGAFWLGGAAFCEHKKSGFWLDSMAVEELALRRYRSLLESGGHDDLKLVDDADIGQSFFTEGFTAGYRRSRLRFELDGLEVCRELDSAGKGLA